MWLDEGIHILFLSTSSLVICNQRTFPREGQRTTGWKQKEGRGKEGRLEKCRVWVGELS